MQFAKPKIDLQRIIEKDEHFVLFWIPMIRIVYTAGTKKYEMCFDSHTPPKLGLPEAYVLLMRNPRHVKIIKKKPNIGTVLEPLTDGKSILRSLKELKKIASRFVDEARRAMHNIPRKLILQLFMPVQAAEAKKISASDQYIQIYALLDAVNIRDNTEYVSEDTIYWPILIHQKEQIVFEPALQEEPSKSYTYLHQRFDLVKTYASKSTNET